MRKICFITGTRSDYGIMAPVMKGIRESGQAHLQVIATNMHLSAKFGNTIEEIKNDGFNVDAEIECLEESDDSSSSIVKAMAKVQEGLAQELTNLTPDIVVILGDRYEALAAACAVATLNIPIAHLHGGEITKGALDDLYRNAITQLSQYHFAATPEYVSRIVAMGKDPEKVFHSGAPGAEVKEVFSRDIEEKFERKTGLTKEDRFIILAMHPVTMLPDKGLKEAKATIKALHTFIEKGFKVLVTLPNSDTGNQDMTHIFKDFEIHNPGKVICIQSLGTSLFHYGMMRAEAMVGNSSSALIEAPSLFLPVVNVGQRQMGRASGPTVEHVAANEEDISQAIARAIEKKEGKIFLKMTKETLNPYYKKDATQFIVNKLLTIKL